MAGIGLLLAGPLRNRGRLTATLAIQALVVLMVSPWLAFWFGQLSLVAPLANLAAVPVFTFRVVPLGLVGTGVALVGLPALYGPAFAGAGWVLIQVEAGLTRLSELPFAAWQGLRPDIVAVACMLTGLAVLFAGRRRWRWLGPAVALLPLTWLGPPTLPEGHARL